MTTLLRAQNLVPGDWRFVAEPRPEFFTADEGALDGSLFAFGFSWESQGFRNYGTAGLACEFTAPTALKTSGIRLSLSMHARRTEVFLNGRALTAVDGVDQRATCDLPADGVRWGESNRLALRVEGHEWTGGEVPDFVRIEPLATGMPDVHCDILFANPAREYPAGLEIELPVSLRATASPGLRGVLAWRVRSDDHRPILAQEQPLAASAQAETALLPLGRLAPGFYAVSLRFSASDGSVEVARDFWIGVAPTQIASEPCTPADFAAFWDQARAELASVAPEFSIIPEAALSTADRQVYTVSMRSIGGVQLKAWYIVPTKPGPHPAILHVPGYSAAMRPEWFLDGPADFIHLALDIRGHGRSAAEINPGFGMPGFVGHDIHDPAQYVYRGAYLDCGRALEFLATREEVDQRRIAVEGMSQGGGLAFATAALFPDRVAACAAGVPFLGVPLEHFRIRTIYETEMREHLSISGRGTWADTLRSMSMVDTRNLADRITCPVFMAVALYDDDCPPHIGFAVYNAITVPKSYHIFPVHGHMMGGQWGPTAEAWIRRQFARQ